MTQRVFILRAHLRGRPTLAGRYEDRIVSKPIGAPRLEPDSAFNCPELIQIFRASVCSTNDHCTHKPRSAFTLRHFSHIPQQQKCATLIVETVSTITGGVDSWLTSQRIYYQSGVVSQRDPAKMFRVVTGFDQRVFQKSRAVLYRSFNISHFIQTDELRR